MYMNYLCELKGKYWELALNSSRIIHVEEMKHFFLEIIYHVVFQNTITFCSFELGILLSMNFYLHGKRLDWSSMAQLLTTENRYESASGDFISLNSVKIHFQNNFALLTCKVQFKRRFIVISFEWISTSNYFLRWKIEWWLGHVVCNSAWIVFSGSYSESMKERRIFKISRLFFPILGGKNKDVANRTVFCVWSSGFSSMVYQVNIFAVMSKSNGNWSIRMV